MEHRDTETQRGSVFWTELEGCALVGGETLGDGLLDLTKRYCAQGVLEFDAVGAEAVFGCGPGEGELGLDHAIGHLGRNLGAELGGIVKIELLD